MTKQTTPDEPAIFAEFRKLGDEALIEACIEAYREVESASDLVAASPIQFHWKLGSAVSVVREREAAIAAKNKETPKHLGSRALGKEFKISAAKVKQSISFYKAFSKESDLLTVTTMRRANGKPLSFDVIAKVSQEHFGGAKGKQRHMKVLTQAAAENWTVKDVQTLIDSETGVTARDQPAGGRTPKIPRTIEEAIARVRRDVESNARYVDTLCTDDNALALVRTAEAGGLTTDAVDNFALFLGEKSRQSAEKLVRFFEGISQQMAARAAEAAAANAPAAAANPPPAKAAATPPKSRGFSPPKKPAAAATA